MRNPLSKNVIIRNRIVSAILFAFTVCYIVLAPMHFMNGVSADPYRDFFLPEVEPSVGVIKVWHIVSFKPFSGSLGNWLKDKAKRYSSRYVNVYFQVTSMTKNEALEQLARGEAPDVLSFVCGSESRDSFREFILPDSGNEPAAAVPYCASGYLLVCDPNALAEKELAVVMSEAGTPNEFKSGKAAACVCDVRGAADLLRAQLNGKCPFFTAEPIDGENDLVQCIGIFGEIDEGKLAYAVGYIGSLLTESAQSSLAQIGLLPVDKNCSPEYDMDWMKKLWESFDPDSIPPFFCG